MSVQTLVLFGIAGAFAVVVIAMLSAAFFTVDQRTTVIVQRFGRFLREAGPGLHVKIPFVDTVIGRINLRVQQLDVTIETKTEDNVFVKMVVAVQYYVLPEKVYDAFYKLEDAKRQITSSFEPRFALHHRCAVESLAGRGCHRNRDAAAGRHLRACVQPCVRHASPIQWRSGACRAVGRRRLCGGGDREMATAA